MSRKQYSKELKLELVKKHLEDKFSFLAFLIMQYVSINYQSISDYSVIQ